MPVALRFGITLLAAAAAVSAADAGRLRAGAARISITPPANAALPMGGYGGRTEGFRGIHDDIYVRAIVLDDGATQAALVTWELLFVPDSVWSELAPRIAAEAGIRPEHLLLSAVHNHGAPTSGGGSGAVGANTAAYMKTVEDATVRAVRVAKERLRPARFGIGAATADINV